MRSATFAGHPMQACGAYCLRVGVLLELHVCHCASWLRWAGRRPLARDSTPRALHRSTRSKGGAGRRFATRVEIGDLAVRTGLLRLLAWAASRSGGPIPNRCEESPGQCIEHCMGLTATQETCRNFFTIRDRQTPLRTRTLDLGRKDRNDDEITRIISRRRRHGTQVSGEHLARRRLPEPL